MKSLDSTSPRPLGSFFILSLLALAGSANAAVTTLAVWRGGEDDGASGGDTSSSTTGIAGGNTLAVTTTGTLPLYSTSITAPGSTMSLQLSGDDLYSAGATVTLTDNVGMEAWVRPTSLNAFDFAISNGRTGNGGYGIVQSGGFWHIVHGNVASGTTGVAVELDAWQHVAYVRDSGVSTLYVNGVATGGTISNDPLTPDTFMLGANLVGTGFEGQFNGYIDHVRLFSFTAGQFNVSDLNLVPEPSVALLSGLAGLALIIRRRR